MLIPYPCSRCATAATCVEPTRFISDTIKRDYHTKHAQVARTSGDKCTYALTPREVYGFTPAVHKLAHLTGKKLRYTHPVHVPCVTVRKQLSIELLSYFIGLGQESHRRHRQTLGDLVASTVEITFLILIRDLTTDCLWFGYTQSVVDTADSIFLQHHYHSRKR